ncbi:hypothetical protein [Bacillus coahuilensis]
MKNLDEETRQTIEDIKSQVDIGELTTEEAREQIKELIKKAKDNTEE